LLLRKLILNGYPTALIERLCRSKVTVIDFVQQNDVCLCARFHKLQEKRANDNANKGVAFERTNGATLIFFIASGQHNL
jgi:hypothetical protein